MSKNDKNDSKRKRKNSRDEERKGFYSGKTLLILFLIVLILVGVVYLLLSKDKILHFFHEKEAQRIEKIENDADNRHTSSIDLSGQSKDSKKVDQVSEIDEEALKRQLEAEIKADLIREFEKEKVELEQKERAEKAQIEAEKKAQEVAEAKKLAAAKKAAEEKAKREAEQKTLKHRDFPIYFVEMEGDTLKLVSIKRRVSFNDSPLTATLNALIEGLLPSEEKANENLMTAIPEETKIRSINIKNGVAFIDFTEQFTFNPYAKEGLIASMKQIIWTATSFPSVKSVQFMINGKTRKYLSSEGIEIDKPLSRESFQ